MSKEGIKDAAKALFTAEITRLMRKYGAVRIAKLVDASAAGVDTLVLFSPVFQVPGDTPLVATTVLDSRLYNVGIEAYGSIKNAAREFGVKR